MSKTNKYNGCIEIPEGLVALFSCRECQGESQKEDVVSEVADDLAEMGVLLKEFSSLLAAVAVHVGNVADGLIETFATTGSKERTRHKSPAGCVVSSAPQHPSNNPRIHIH